MSNIFISFIDPNGKKGSTRFYCLDDEDFFVFIDRIKDHLLACYKDGYRFLRIEVT